MAHDIAKINGADAMFCVGNREAAWHALGQRTGQAVTWAEAVKHAQLDWDVVKGDVYSRSPIAPFAPFKLNDVKAVTRTNDGAYLGTVGKDFELLQNREMFTYMDALLEAENGAHYETAGALGNGAQVWALAILPTVSRLRGTNDVTNNYLLGFNGHDGSTANTVKLVRERVVCRNTLNVALGEAGRKLRFKHTRNMRIKMEEARQIMLGVRELITQQDAQLDVLAQRRVNGKVARAVFAKMFPDAFNADEEKRSTRQNNVAMKILELFESNDSNAIPEIKGSALNLLNAFTEYADHFRSVRITDAKAGMTVTQARAQEAVFGTGDSFKQDAMCAVMELTADGGPTDVMVPTSTELERLFNL